MGGRRDIHNTRNTRNTRISISSTALTCEQHPEVSPIRYRRMQKRMANTGQTHPRGIFLQNPREIVYPTVGDGVLGRPQLHPVSASKNHPSLASTRDFDVIEKEVTPSCD